MSDVKKAQEEKHAQIAELAYQKWQEAGEPLNDGVDFWLEAEQQWERNRLLEERWQLPSDDGYHLLIRPDYAVCHHEVEEDEIASKKPTFLERLKSWL